MAAALAYTLPQYSPPRPTQPRPHTRRINTSPFSRYPLVREKPRQGVKNLSPQIAPSFTPKTHDNPPSITPVADKPTVGCSVAAERGVGGQRLFHYTNEAGASGITGSNSLNPSLWKVGTKDVRYGNGQYVTDIVPGTRTPAELSRDLVGNPFQGNRFTHYVEIDATGLGAVQGRPGVFVIPNQTPLDLTGRVIKSGKVPGQ